MEMNVLAMLSKEKCVQPLACQCVSAQSIAVLKQVTPSRLSRGVLSHVSLLLPPFLCPVPGGHSTSVGARDK